MQRRLHTFALAGAIALSALGALGTSVAQAAAPVDINRASQAELESIKGIGPALSTKILNARKAGEFKSWADLTERVSGIGTANASRLSKAGLTVAGSGYSGPTAAVTRPYRAVKGGTEKTASERPAKAAKAPKMSQG